MKLAGGLCQVVAFGISSIEPFGSTVCRLLVVLVAGFTAEPRIQCLLIKVICYPLIHWMALVVAYTVKPLLFRMLCFHTNIFHFLWFLYISPI
jgi:hypothetical protein